MSAEEEGMTSYRPALRAFTSDYRQIEDELLAGFASRRALLEWLQQVAVRTLGKLSQDWFEEMGHQFNSLESTDRTLMASLVPTSDSNVSQAAATQVRERLAATTVRPAFHRAFRRLRDDVGEYIDASENAEHDPDRQRFVAMRPALDELERDQQSALEDCLSGFDSRAAILRWGDDVELATHGEIDAGFITRCYTEPSTASILTGDDEQARHARELFVARHLLPTFNQGVRDLTVRAGELPETERVEQEVPLA
jgi:hypothetical protein